MICRWQKRETIPEVFAPPWFFELAKPLFQSEAECEAIDMEMIFYSHTNKTHFHKKGFALSLVLKVRIVGTRKQPSGEFKLNLDGAKIYAVFWVQFFFDLRLRFVKNVLLLGQVPFQIEWLRRPESLLLLSTLHCLSFLRNTSDDVRMQY